MFGAVCTLGVLAVSSIYDIKNKQIPLWILCVGFVPAGGSLIVCGIMSGWFEVLTAAVLSLLPGAGLLVLSFLSEKKVGTGDGLLLMLIGLLEGSRIVLLVFCAGLFLQSLSAVLLLILKRAEKQTCIPFAPFLLAARILLLCG